MRYVVLPLLFSSLAAAQSTTLLRPDPINLIPPATSADGNIVVFAAAMSPDGTPRPGTDLYIFDRELRRLTNYAGPANVTGVSRVTWAAGFAAFTAQPSGPDEVEEVHVYDAARAADRTVASEKATCPQLLCLACKRTCLGPVHLSADAGRVLYSIAQNQPFRIVNADGTGAKTLPVYSGVLAPSPQRVISRGGQLVFSSSAPSGPTFAAAATDVHLINLDGMDLRQVTHLGKPEFFALNATISADGSLIAFESNWTEAGSLRENQIFLVRSDGTGFRRLSSGPDAATGPSISADGSVVVFLQSGQIKRVNTAGDAAPVTLTLLSASAARDAVVTDAGTQVVFTLGPAAGTAAAVYRIPSDSMSANRFFDRIYAPRFLNPNGVVSAAGFGQPSPGSLISVYGGNFGTDELQQAGSFPLPESLGGVSVAINGHNVPLVAVTPWQINAQIPQSVSAGSAQFQVLPLPPFALQIAPASPEVLSLPLARNSRYTQAAAFHAGTSILADVEHPAASGDVLEIYGFGLGLTDPSPAAGLPSPASPPARAVRMPRVQIGASEARVLFAGLTPGLAGVYQVNIVVPAGLTPGLQTLSWNGVEGPLWMIAVK